MVRNGTPSVAAFGSVIAMLEELVASSDGRSVSAIARDLGIPVSTAHRQVHTLLEEGLLPRHRHGYYTRGPRLLRLIGGIGELTVMVNVSATILHRVAAHMDCIVQLGTLDDGMVTYRIKVGNGAGDLFTRVGMQLEAYCTGIGKVLLANLDEMDLENYLAAGPFPALTTTTITNPAALMDQLRVIRRQDYALDDREISDGLRCVAVPIRRQDGSVAAAISATRLVDGPVGATSDRKYLAALRDASAEIEGLVHQTVEQGKGLRNDSA